MKISDYPVLESIQHGVQHVGRKVRNGASIAWEQHILPTLEKIPHFPKKDRFPVVREPMLPSTVVQKQPIKAKNNEWWKTPLRAVAIFGTIGGLVWWGESQEPKAEAPPQKPFNKMDMTFNPNQEETFDGILQLMNETDTTSYLILNPVKGKTLLEAGALPEGTVQLIPASAGISEARDFGPQVKVHAQAPIESFVQNAPHNIVRGVTDVVLQQDRAHKSPTVMDYSHSIPVTRNVIKDMKENGGIMLAIPIKNSEANEMGRKIEQGQSPRFMPKR